MRGFLPVFKRELFSFFVTPIAWIAISAFLVIQGLHFSFVLANFAQVPELSADNGPVQQFFGQTVFLYLPLFFVCPVLTMRLFAEERRTGTIEPLLTTPVTTSAVVLAKYAAVLLSYVAMWLPTLLYMWTVSSVGYIDWNVVGTGYLAVFGVGAGYLSVGLMTSALSRSQLAAAILCAMAIMGLFIVGIGGEFILDEGFGRELASYVSVWSQMNDFSRGIVDSRRLLYNATTVALPLYITVRAVEAWRLE
jgi:ABC-2 type transport system permease protein